MSLEREEKIDELLDNLFFGEKMISRGEATREELQEQIDKINKELELLGYYSKNKKGKTRREK
jgi:hypothetical protein